MNRLRAPALQQVVETLHAGRSGTRDALQVMNRGDAGERLLNRILRGPVRNARPGEWDCDVNLVGGKSLRLAGLARGKLRPHSDFGSSATRIPRGKDEFACYSADLRRRRWRGFLAAGRADQCEAEQERNFKMEAGNERNVWVQAVRAAPQTLGGLAGLAALKQLKRLVV